MDYGFLLSRWIEEGHPGFISGHDQFAEMLPAADFFDTLQIGLASACADIFHGRGEEARDPAGAESNEL